MDALKNILVTIITGIILILLYFVWVAVQTYKHILIIITGIFLVILVVITLYFIFLGILELSDILARRRAERRNKTMKEQAEIGMIKAQTEQAYNDSRFALAHGKPGDLLVLRDAYNPQEPYKMIKVPKALPDPNSQEQEELALPDPYNVNNPTLPDLVKFEDYHSGPYSTNQLFVGVTVNNKPVYESLKSMAHIGVAGTTRWGKSTFVRGLLFQMVASGDNLAYYLSDVGGTTFIDFPLPWVSTLEETEKLAEEVVQQMYYRANLFKKLGESFGKSIKNLEVYNTISGEQLPRIFFAMDETTILMYNSSNLAQNLITLVAGAAKYGISLCLLGQNWKADSMNTVIRDQFSSRFQFKAMDRIQGSLFIKDSGAEDISVKGRAMTYFPEMGKLPLQTPIISDDTIAQIGNYSPTILDMPARNDLILTPDQDDILTVEAIEQVKNDTGKLILSKVCELLNITPSSYNYNKLRGIVSKYNL